MLKMSVLVHLCMYYCTEITNGMSKWSILAMRRLHPSPSTITGCTVILWFPLVRPGMISGLVPVCVCGGGVNQSRCVASSHRTIHAFP